MTVTLAPLHATPAQLAIAPRYSSLDAAWPEIKPGLVVRNDAGEVIAGDAGVLPWLTPENVGGVK